MNPLHLMKSLSLLACLAGAAALPAQAGPVLDQFDNGPRNGYGGIVGAFGIDISQTFTVGLAGRLDQLAVDVARTANAVGDLIVEVRSTTGGVPDAAAASVLASASIAVGSVSVGAATVADPFSAAAFAFHFVDISAFDLIVTPGEVLALTLRSASLPGGYAWGFDAPGNYAGGHGYFRANNPGTGLWNIGGADQRFGTFVSAVPEPATLALTALALLAAAGARRRP